MGDADKTPTPTCMHTVPPSFHNLGIYGLFTGVFISLEVFESTHLTFLCTKFYAALNEYACHTFELINAFYMASGYQYVITD